MYVIFAELAYEIVLTLKTAKWDNDAKQTRQLADDWTNMRTIDESHVKSSWEIVVWHYKERKGVQKGS